MWLVLCPGHEYANEVGAIVDRSEEEDCVITSCMNFLQTGRISLDSVALNIMTCLLCGVLLNISCTSRRISVTATQRNKLFIIQNAMLNVRKILKNRSVNSG